MGKNDKSRGEYKRHKVVGAYFIKPVRSKDGGFRYGVRVNGEDAHWKVNGKKVLTKKSLKDVLQSLSELEPEGATHWDTPDVIVYPKPSEETFAGSFEDYEKRHSRKVESAVREQEEAPGEDKKKVPEVDEKKLITGVKNLLAAHGANLAKVDQAQLEKLAGTIKNLIATSNGGIVVDEASPPRPLTIYRKRVEEALLAQTKRRRRRVPRH